MGRSGGRWTQIARQSRASCVRIRPDSTGPDRIGGGGVVPANEPYLALPLGIGPTRRYGSNPGSGTPKAPVDWALFAFSGVRRNGNRNGRRVRCAEVVAQKLANVILGPWFLCDRRPRRPPKTVGEAGEAVHRLRAANRRRRLASAAAGRRAAARREASTGSIRTVPNRWRPW